MNLNVFVRREDQRWLTRQAKSVLGAVVLTDSLTVTTDDGANKVKLGPISYYGHGRFSTPAGLTNLRGDKRAAELIEWLDEHIQLAHEPLTQDDIQFIATGARVAAQPQPRTRVLPSI